MNLLLTTLFLAGRWAAIVLPADARDDELAQNLTDVLVATLAEHTHAQVIGREEFRTQLGLSDRGVLGCAGDTACLGRVGVQLKVEKMVVGQVSRGVGDEYILFMNLIDVPALKGESEGLQKVHGIPALVAKVQELGKRFSGDKTHPQVVTPPGAAPATPSGEVPLSETIEIGVRERGPRFRTAAWTLIIGGGVAAVAGIVTGAAAKDKATQIESRANPSRPVSFDPTLRKLDNDGHTLDNVARVSWAVAILAGVTGGILYYVGRPVTVTTDGHSVAVAGSF
jgi:hypothetical protein